MLSPTRLLLGLVAGMVATACRQVPPPAPVDRVPLAAFAAALRPIGGDGDGRPRGAGAFAWRSAKGWGPRRKRAPRPDSAGGRDRSRASSFELVAARDLELPPARLVVSVRPTAASSVSTLRGQRPAGRRGGRRTDGYGTLRFAVEAARLQAGENILELRYARWNDRPGEAPWAVAWDGVRFDRRRRAQAPVAATADRRRRRDAIDAPGRNGASPARSSSPPAPGSPGTRFRATRRRPPRARGRDRRGKRSPPRAPANGARGRRSSSPNPAGRRRWSVRPARRGHERRGPFAACVSSGRGAPGAGADTGPADRRRRSGLGAAASQART